MSNGFWHNRNDFRTTPPSQLVLQLWEDDKSNRQRSLTTFKNELALVNQGLTLYLEAIQGAFKEHDKWKDDVQLNACVAMLIHALNVFLARRHLLTLGYVAETRIFARSVHESLYQALAFSIDTSLAKRFYKRKTIDRKEIRKRLSQALTNDKTQADEIFRQAGAFYGRLSKGVHPTLDSFSLRTAAQEHGDADLAKAVPEGVLIGGLLEDKLGHEAWLDFAKDVEYGLEVVRQVIKEGTGEWTTRFQTYRSKVNVALQAH